MVCAWALVACETDPCEEAYEKEQACVQGMNCDSLGPAASGPCNTKKQRYSQKYDVYKAVCGAACECEGKHLEDSERINNCTLEPVNLCQCR
jgi:hypothetical protein